MLAEAADTLECHLNIGEAEVIALEKQRHGLDFAHGVGDAIAEIELRGVAATLAVSQEGPNRHISGLTIKWANGDFRKPQ